jgi:hypothetical protein
MSHTHTKLNYRIIHYYDIKSSNIYNVELFSDILNKGVFIKNEKLIQSTKNQEEQFVIDVFQREYILDISNYFNQFYSSNKNLKMLIIEEV